MRVIWSPFQADLRRLWIYCRWKGNNIRPLEESCISRGRDISYPTKSTGVCSPRVSWNDRPSEDLFLHGAGQIRHVLVMGWAGESTAKLEQTSELRKEISRSKQEIRALGVRHLDLRPDNILWNAELQRALIIDFHRSELDRRPTADRYRSLKRPRHRADMPESKIMRAA